MHPTFLPAFAAEYATRYPSGESPMTIRSAARRSTTIFWAGFTNETAWQRRHLLRSSWLCDAGSHAAPVRDRKQVALIKRFPPNCLSKAIGFMNWRMF